MQKTIKIIVGLIGGLVLLIVAAVVAVVILVNPNDYKPQITQKVYQYTGRQLTLQGDMGWTFFPRLGLQLNQAQLSNAPGFGDQPFASIKQADVSVAVLPLLVGTVELGKITLNGLELNLIKNKNGVTNWQDLLARPDQKKTPEDKAKQAAVNSKSYFSAFALAGIDINDGHIHWQDRQAQKSYDINDLQLHTQTIKLTQAFPIKLSFIVRDPGLQIKVDLQGKITADKQQETLKIEDLRLIVDDSALTGTLTVKNFVKPALVFDLNLDHVDLNQYSPAKSPKVTTLAIGDDFFVSSAMAAPKPKFAAANEGLLPVDVLRSVNAQGRLKIGSLQLGKLNPTDIVLQLNAADGLLNFSPITAKIYQGNYNGGLNLDVRGVLPKITGNLQLKGIQAEPLFRDMSNVAHLQLTGVGDFNAQLATQGNSSNALVSHLTGQGKLTFTNGVLKGIDVPYWIEAGRALIHRELPAAPSGPRQTDFGNLTATFVITNGLVKNNDLLLRATNLEARGEGAADLVNQRLDYRLNASILRANGQPDGTVIPLHISGPFDNLRIRPAVEDLLKAQLKEKITDEISKHLDGDVGDKLKNTLNSLFK